MKRDHEPVRTVLSVAAGREGDRVTTLELFFDLVYAFAFTQVTSLMSHESAPGSLVDGYIVLSLLWFAWCAFAWLANQARADEGILRGAFVVAIAAVFLLSLAIPDAFRGVPGGLPGASVVAVCYTVVRLTHISTYLAAARRQPALRRQILVTLGGSLVPTVALLGVGAAAGEPARRWIWLAAVLYDFASVYVSALRGGGWQIPSAAHFAERHGLVVILALGESVVSVGAGLRSGPLSVRVATGAVLALLIAVGLWSAYFPRALPALEESLTAARDRQRAILGQDVFTFLHFPVIAGIIVGALGIKLAMARLDADHLGALGGWALGAGIGLFLAGTVGAIRRADGQWLTARIAAIALLLALSPLLAAAPALLAIAIVAAVVLALALAERRPGGGEPVVDDGVRRGGRVIESHAGVEGGEAGR